MKTSGGKVRRGPRLSRLQANSEDPSVHLEKTLVKVQIPGQGVPGITVSRGLATVGLEAERRH